MSYPNHINQDGDISIFDIHPSTIASYPTIGTNSFTLDEFVKGEMITTQITLNNFEITQMNIDQNLFKSEIKKRLATQLAEQILDNKLTEFTKQEDMHTGETIFRARAYLTPDDKVRIVRKATE